jgi:hypothetical protein
MAQTRLQTIEVSEVESPVQPTVSRETSALGSLLAMSLKALSQRALVALASLVDLALIASAFVLWFNVMGEPSVLQLFGLGGYAAFILTALYTRHR